jgi:hypothetical protein
VIPKSEQGKGNMSNEDWFYRLSQISRENSKTVRALYAVYQFVSKQINRWHYFTYYAVALVLCLISWPILQFSDDLAFGVAMLGLVFTYVGYELWLFRS